MRVQGYYVNCDDAYCPECFRDEYAESTDEWGDGWPIAIFGDTESDTPTHCLACGSLILHHITSDGYTYVADAIRECIERETRSAPVHAWADEYWPDELTDEDADRFFALPLAEYWATGEGRKVTDAVGADA